MAKQKYFLIDANVKPAVPLKDDQVLVFPKLKLRLTNENFTDMHGDKLIAAKLEKFVGLNKDKKETPAE